MVSSTPQRWRAGAMARLVDAARRAHGSLMELLGLMGEGTYPEAYDAVRLAAVVLGEEFYIGKARKPLLDIDKLKRQLRYHKRWRINAVATLAEERADRFGRNIQAIGFVRAGLSTPLEPLRRLRDFLCEFNVGETKAISHTYIGHRWNAFSEILKTVNRNSTDAMVRELI